MKKEEIEEIEKYYMEETLRYTKPEYKKELIEEFKNERRNQSKE